MEIIKILEGKVSLTKGELREGIEYIEKINRRKKEIKNGRRNRG